MESETSVYHPVEVAILLYTDCHHFVSPCLLTEDFAEGDFLKILSAPETKAIFSNLNSFGTDLVDSLKKAISQWLREDFSFYRQLYVLSVGVAALLAFLQDNWIGPSLKSSVLWLNVNSLPKEEFQAYVVSRLVLDGESVFFPVRHPELLLLAQTCLFADISDLKSSAWWKFRYLVLQQQILEEWSSQLHTDLCQLKEQLLHFNKLSPNPKLTVLLNLEIVQMHLQYHEVQASSEVLKRALESCEMSVELIGALGKRTRFQQKEISQLTLRVQSNEEPLLASLSSIENMPKDVVLADDVRLNKILFSNPEDEKNTELSPLQQACVLGLFMQTQRSQPKDKLVDEELQAYISFLLSHPCVWGIQFSTLFYRCKIEANHSRTVERSMTQMQELLSAVDENSPSVSHRLPLAFCAYLVPRWRIEEELARLLVSLGCINSALDIFLRLQSWEEAIACYNHLQLRHKSAEIIRQELGKKETVKLWCLLGDATDDVTCYEKAWVLSKERSARAQRHWGLYFFHRKQYEDAIPHLQQSLSCNSLQVTLWFQLGYAALQQEEWTIAANSYRRYCFLDPENFEAWNNLAKAYVKQGQKNRAWKALQEALKWNFENWRVWDNFMIVSLDCAVFEEVIRAYHRILDLRDKHIDTEVLEIIVKAVLENLPDSDGLPSGRLSEKTLKLFGRITAQVTSDWKVWHLYSRLTAGATPSSAETLLRAVHHLQKALRCAIADASWSRDSYMCSRVLELSLELCKVTLEYVQKSPATGQSLSVLSSAKLSLRGVIAKLQKDRLNLLTGQIEDELQPLYKEVEQALEDIVQASQVLPK